MKTAGQAVVFIVLACAVVGSGLIIARVFNYRLKPGSFPRVTFEKFKEVPIGAKAMSEEKEAIKKEGTLGPPATQYVTTAPYFTWDIQTVPPTREYDFERDGPYPVVQVHNSQSPGMKKQGRLIRPITKANAELAIWLVDIDGREVTVHDPEEAWGGG